MYYRYAFQTVAGIALLFVVLPVNRLYAGVVTAQSSDSAFDLINAVNALRVTNGLAPYSISPILMFTAQNQADFMAANGIVTHSGPGGIGLTDRLLAAGYPLAGDLSLGGFRAENITSGSEGKSAQSAVDQWTGDAPHLNTMLSPNLTEIGAGVAFSGGRVYFVIDAARPTTGGASQVVATSPAGGSAVPANEAPILAVVVSTPNSNGEVVHEVLFGQSLWQIAIAYAVKIDDIKRLNNLTSDSIYPGDTLLIKNETPVASETPTETLVFIATSFPTETTTPVPVMTFTAAPVPTDEAGSSSNSMVMGIAIGIIILALLAGGIFIRFGPSNMD